VELELKPGKFMPGLVEGLIGIKKGETREIAVQFPKRSGSKIGQEVSGMKAIFDVLCLQVQERKLAEVGDDFANRVKEGMTWEECDARLREGVGDEAKAREKAKTHTAIEDALFKTLPEEVEVPDTMINQVSKESFAAMLSDMRERGTSDEELQKLVKQENYDLYMDITRPLQAKQVLADLMVAEVGRQQSLEVDQEAVNSEIVSRQAQAMQRGEKFKESEVRPRIEAGNQRAVVLDWLASKAEIAMVEKGTKKVDPLDELTSPEELVKAIKEREAAKKATK
jgi:trigger factor